MNTTSRLEIDYNGDLITSAVSAINFTGNGVIVTGSGTNVEVSIPGANGTPTGPNNSVQLNVDGSLVGSSSLIFNPITGILTVAGNVTGNYFVGDGSRLTNVSGSNVTGYVPLAQYANTAGTVSLASVAAVAYSVSGANVTGIVAQANIANTANRAAIANVAYSVSGSNVVGSVAQAGYATRAVAADSVDGIHVVGQVSSAANAVYAISSSTANSALFANTSYLSSYAGYVTQPGQANITRVGVLQELEVAGNITFGQYIFGDARYLTNIPSSYGNANVADFLDDYNGNITCLRISGNGTGLSNITGANINGIVPSANYAASSGSAVNAVSAQTAGTVTQSLQPNIAAVGTLNSLSVFGGVIAESYKGNGAALTNLNASNISGTVGNAIYAVSAGSATSAGTATNSVSAVTAGSATYALTVANAAQPNITSVGTLTSVAVTGNASVGNLVTGGKIEAVGNIAALGNISGTYFIGNGAFLTGVGNIGSTYGNSNVNLLLASYGSNVISTTGNVTAGYVFGNGSQLTGLPATYGNSNVVTLLAGYGNNSISTTGNITSGNILTGNIINSANIAVTASANTWFFGTDGILTLPGGATLKEGVALGALALGYQAGQTSQGIRTVALGQSAGQTSQGARAVAVGINAGQTSQGAAAVAIGAFAGPTGQGDNSIILNATGANVNQTRANTFTVAPVRNDVANTAQVMFYNTTSSEITYGNTISVAGNITAGNIIGNVVASGAGTPTIASTGNLDLSAVTAVRVVGGGSFRLPTLTTAQIANLTAINGDMVYNSTTAKIQAYAGNVWGNITLS
jgi:hypothetical protein